MTYLKKAIITGAYIEVLLLVTRIVLSWKEFIDQNAVSMRQHFTRSDFIDMTNILIFTNLFVLIVLIIAAFTIDKIIKVKNNE